MLDTKDTLLLEYILKNSEWKSNKQIIDDLDISISQLNYHIGHVNLFLKKNKLDEIRLVSKKINNSDKIKELYSRYLSQNQAIYLSADDRRRIMKLIMSFCDFVSINYFEKIFDTTHNTVFKDFKQIKIEIEEYRLPTLKFISSQKGYQLQASPNDYHIFLINEIIDFINNDHDNAILFFIINNINLDEYFIIKNNNISHKKMYEIVLEKTYSLFEQIEYINLQPRTIALLLYFLLIKKQNNIIDIDNNEIKNTDYYNIASNFIDDLKSHFKIKDNLGVNEKKYLSYLLSSWTNIDLDLVSNINKQKALNLFDDFKTYFESKGWEVYEFSDNCEFYKYYVWTKEMFTYKLKRNINVERYISAAINEKSDILYYEHFLECFNKYKQEYGYSYRSSFVDMFKLFYINISSLPPVLEAEDIYFITDLKGNLIAKEINKIKKSVKKIKNIHVINIYYYQKNKTKFTDKTLITNCPNLKEIKFLIVGINIVKNG